MKGMDYWRFCDALTVVQAALLIVGEDPGQVADYLDGWNSDKKPDGYLAVLSALQHSIISSRLKATKVWLNLDPQHSDAEHPVKSIDWPSTLVEVDDLKIWLERKGVQSGFFFPAGPVTAKYLNVQNDCYAPKLAAAVNAWKAVSEERRTNQSGRSVKSDLTKWLNLHAPEYALTNDEGEPNRQAIEEVAKVANWNPKGGAPKTPGQSSAEADDELDPPF